MMRSWSSCLWDKIIDLWILEGKGKTMENNSEFDEEDNLLMERKIKVWHER